MLLHGRWLRRRRWGSRYILRGRIFCWSGLCGTCRRCPLLTCYLRDALSRDLHFQRNVDASALDKHPYRNPALAKAPELDGRRRDDSDGSDGSKTSCHESEGHERRTDDKHDERRPGPATQVTVRNPDQRSSNQCCNRSREDVDGLMLKQRAPFVIQISETCKNSEYACNSKQYETYVFHLDFQEVNPGQHESCRPDHSSSVCAPFRLMHVACEQRGRQGCTLTERPRDARIEPARGHACAGRDAS